MKFKEAKKYKKEFISRVSELISEGHNITSSTKQSCLEFDLHYSDGVRRVISKMLEIRNVTDNKDQVNIEDSDEFVAAKNKEFDRTKQKFIISWAQSETDIHNEFLNNIEAYAKFLDAEILITAGRYKNPTSLSSSKHTKDKEENKSLSWHKRIIPYLDANRHKIHNNLCVVSDVRVQPTASTPLSGFNGLTGLESCIIGHPRVHLKSLPVLDDYPNKLLLTTGAVTVDNYTDTKAGKKGEFHHTLGFVIVELDGDVFHVRQVQADDDGSFYDLDLFVENSEIHKHSGAEAIVFGDLHLGETNEEVLKCSFELADYVNTREIILHDVFDGRSISHHERNMPLLLLERESDGSGNLVQELSQMIDFFQEYSKYEFVMVRSNHDEFLDRWINDVDWRKVPNKEAYIKLVNLMIDSKDKKGVIPAYLKNQRVENVHCLGINDSYPIMGFECGIHGHIGANGSRGGVIQFKNLNTKNITGHTHQPCREDGHLSVGTLTHLRVGYNKGASSWLNSNVIIYPNGKAQHVHIIKNKFKII